MKSFFAGLLLLSIITANAQEKFSVGLFYRPELTRYSQDRYSPFFEQAGPVSKLNQGINAQFKYVLVKNFSLGGGIGFVYRKFFAERNFDQSSIPPPRQSWTQEYVSTRKINYHIFEFPLSLDYDIRLNRLSLSAGAGYLFNYLWNAYYDNHNSRYDGNYKKRYWLNNGSAFATAGLDYHWNKMWSLAFSYAYVFGNFDEEDPFLHSNWHPGRTIDHNYMYAMIGVRKAFRF